MHTRTVRTWPRQLLVRPWLLTFLPISAATSGFGVLLPLLILIPLHGSWSDVALAATLFNVAIILSSVVWGSLADRFRSRRAFLLVNFVGFAVAYLLLARLTSLFALLAIYALIGLVAPAGISASNLLILEKFPSSERPLAFASFQEMSMIGSVLGLLLGYFWTLSPVALEGFLYVLAGLASASAALAWFAVEEPHRALTTLHVSRHPESLLSRTHLSASLRVAVPFFPTRPSLRSHPVARFRHWVREELHHEFPLILVASFLFNLSANLFNISYTPYLYSIGIGAGAIFLINLGNNAAQTVAFPFSGGLTNRLGPDRLVRLSTYVRALGYLGVAGLTFVVLLTQPAFDANVFAFAVMGGAIAIYSTASSMLLFRAVDGHDAGNLLGLNSAFGGLAAVGGAILAAMLAFVGSYRLVFLVSAAALLVSLPIWAASHTAYLRRRSESLIAPPKAAPDRPAPTPQAQAE